MAVFACETPRKDQPFDGRRDAQPELEGGSGGSWVCVVGKGDWRGRLCRLPAVDPPPPRLAVVPPHERLRRQTHLRRQAHHDDAGPLPPVFRAVPAVVARSDRVLCGGHLHHVGRPRRGHFEVWDYRRRVLLLGPLPLGQLLARAVHVAPAHQGGRAPLRRRRVDLGAWRSLHDRPSVPGAGRVLRLDASPHRVHARRSPPLLQPALLPRRGSDEAPEGLFGGEGSLQLRPARHHSSHVGNCKELPLRRRRQRHPIHEVHLHHGREEGLVRTNSDPPPPRCC
mmetsp:Transcript_4136/g.12863  ORF Transcript_4136/g.12863 Transcript_4136/m.12863 type:complete len:282 (-) Transcript_4136:36-881(-)